MIDKETNPGKSDNPLMMPQQKCLIEVSRDERKKNFAVVCCSCCPSSIPDSSGEPFDETSDDSRVLAAHLCPALPC